MTPRLAPGLLALLVACADSEEQRQREPVAPGEQGDFDIVEQNLRQAIERSPADRTLRDDLGRHLDDAGRHDEALAWYRQQREAEPDQALWALRLSEELHGASRAEDSLAEAERALDQLSSASVDHRMKLLEVAGRAARDLGRVDLATRYLQRAADLAEQRYLADPRTFTGCPFQALGTLYRDAGQPERGLTEYLRAADGEPYNAHSQWIAASAAAELGRPEIARDYADRAAVLEPNNADFSRLQAQVRSMLAQRPGGGSALPAEDALEAAIIAYERYDFDRVARLAERGQRERSDARLGVLEALVLTQQGDWERAALRLERVTQAAPDLPAIAVGRAHLAIAHQEHEAAEAELERARALLQAERAQGTAWDRLTRELLWLAQGWLASNRGQHRVAISAFDRILQQHPADRYALLGKGNALNFLGELPKAEACFLRILELEPDNRYALAELALVELNAGDTEAAQAYFERARALDPDSYTCPHEGLGLVYLRRGDYAQAEAYFERAIAINPDIEFEKYNGLARIRMQAGRYDEAERLLRKSMKNYPADPTAAQLLERIEQLREDDSPSEERAAAP